MSLYLVTLLFDSTTGNSLTKHPRVAAQEEMIHSLRNAV